MSNRVRIRVPRAKLAEFCLRNHIRRLAFFGSVLRADFCPRSDVDVLAEFEPEYVPGLLGLAGMELELSELLGGRKVDLNTPGFFRPELRERILEGAAVQYGEDR